MPAASDVVVVGAGVAGLAAATALAAGGARVHVVEARGTLGGRSSSFVDRASGTLVDNGQHVVLGCYRETFTFLDRIGGRDGIWLQPALEVPIVDRNGERSTLHCPPWPSPWHLAGGLLRWKALGWRDCLAALRFSPRLMAARRAGLRAGEADADLATQTVAQWLRHHGQTDRLVELLWEPLAVAALNQPIEIAAAAPFVSVLGGVFGPDPRDSAIGLPTRPLGQLFGESAARFLADRGSRVERHAPARLVFEEGALTGVEVRGTRIRAAAVVAAVPWNAWRTLVSDERAATVGLAALRTNAIARRSSPIVTVNLWCDREVLDVPFVGLPGRTFQWIFARPPGDRLAAGVHERGPFRLSLVSSGAGAVAGETDDTLTSLAWRELTDALPSARRASVARARVVRERQATFSLAPGQPPRPGLRSEVRGLWLAGDWTDTGLPATIEGAVLSGHRVAAAILEARGTD